MEPDYLFADSLLAALIEAGAFRITGICYSRERQAWRVQGGVPRRHLGYTKTFGEALELRKAYD